MGRILIDTRDIRDAARDLRGGVGAISEARASVNSVFRGSWLGPNGGGFQSRWDQELAVISQVGNEVERIAGDLDGYASRVDSEQRLGSQIRGVAGWTLRTGKSLFSRVARFFQAGWNTIMAFLTRIANLIREALAFIRKALGKVGFLLILTVVASLAWNPLGLVLAAWGFSAIGSLGPLRAARNAYFEEWAKLFPTFPVGEPSSTQGSNSPIADAMNLIKSPPPEGLAPGQFEIRDDGQGNIVVVLRGLDMGSGKANSPAEVASETGGFGPYSAQVEAAIRAFKLEHYPNSVMSVSLVGHSQGGIVARNILDDAKFWKDGIKMGTVVTIESPVDGRRIPPEAPAVYQFNNNSFNIDAVISKLDVDMPGGPPNEHVVNVATGRGHDADQFNSGDQGTPQDQKHWSDANSKIAGSPAGRNWTSRRYQRT